MKEHFKIKCRRGIIYLTANTTATSAGPVKSWRCPVHEHLAVGADSNMVLAKCSASLQALFGQSDHFYFVLFLSILNIF